MKLAHKNGLPKKFIDGEGDQRDKERLPALHIDTWYAKPIGGNAYSRRCPFML
jgi:hypothetical protein